MPHYQGKKYYFEVSNPPEVLPGRRMRVQGVYAPVNDRDVLMRSFSVTLKTRALNPSGEILEAALEAQAAHREDRMEREEGAFGVR